MLGQCTAYHRLTSRWRGRSCYDVRRFNIWDGRAEQDTMSHAKYVRPPLFELIESSRIIGAGLNSVLLWSEWDSRTV